MHMNSCTLPSASTSSVVWDRNLPSGVTESEPLLSIEPKEFAQKFSQEPFRIRHRLNDHPLFQMERLLKLSQSLPSCCIEYNAGQIPMSMEHAQTPMNGLSAGETIRRISECKSWLVLKYVERDPEYAALLQQCLDEVKAYSDAIAPGMCSGQAFIFITSPGSVTPYHIDPEHNFLLQVRGGKRVHLYDGRVKSLLTEENLERFYSDRGRNIPFQPEFDQHSWVNELQPGDGLHFPVTYPHWVQNLDEVSVSFSMTFRTPDLDRRRAIYQIHDRLRRWGLSPNQVGTHPLRDSVLFNGFRVLRRLKLVGK